MAVSDASGMGLQIALCEAKMWFSDKIGCFRDVFPPFIEHELPPSFTGSLSPRRLRLESD